MINKNIPPRIMMKYFRLGINIKAIEKWKEELDLYDKCYIIDSTLYYGFSDKYEECHIIMSIEDAFTLCSKTRISIIHVFYLIADTLYRLANENHIKANKKMLVQWRSKFWRGKESFDHLILLFNEMLLYLLIKKIIPNKIKL